LLYSTYDGTSNDRGAGIFNLKKKYLFRSFVQHKTFRRRRKRMRKRRKRRRRRRKRRRRRRRRRRGGGGAFTIMFIEPPLPFEV
jgi:hypothetical protein